MMRAVAIIVLGLSLLCVPAFPEEPGGGVGFEWTSFKVGSWVMIRTTTTIGSEKSVMEETQTLVSVAKDGAFKIKYVTKSRDFGRDERTQEFPALDPTLAGLPPIDSTMDPKPPGGVPLTPLPSIKGGRTKQVGKEALMVQGKEFPCTITEATMEMDGMKSCTRAWSSEDSGLRLKMESETTGAIKQSYKDLVTKIGEKVRIGGKAVACIVRHTTRTTTRKGEHGRPETTSDDEMEWFSPDVPGGMVRFEGRSNGDTTIMEAVAFEAKK